MDAWLKFGSFLSSHTVWFVLGAVSVGILAPGVLSPLRPYVPVMFACTIFQSSLGITFRALKETARRPLTFAIIIAWAHVCAPLAAWGLGTLLFGYDHNIVIGIVLGYAVPVAATSVMWVGLYRGNVWAMLATLLISTLIAPFTLPFTLQLMFGASVQMDGAGMMQSMLFTVAIPALVGLLVNEGTRGWGARKLSGALQPAARLAIPLIVGTNSTAISDYVLHLTPELFGVLVFVLCFSVCSFFAGFAIAKVTRQKDDDTVTLMFGCGMRNITAGAVVAAQYFAPATVFPVIAGTLFQQALASVFGPVANRLLGRGGRRRSSNRPRASTDKVHPRSARPPALSDGPGSDSKHRS